MVRSVALGLAMLLTVSAVISSITTTLYPDRDTSLGWGGTLVVAIAAVSFWLAWWASGRPNDRIGAWLTVATTALFLFGLGPIFPGVSATLAVGFAVPVLCATLLLDIRGTLAAFALSGVLGTLFLVLSDTSVVEGSFIAGIAIAVTSLTVIVAALREGDLAKVKQLRQFEHRDAERLKGELELAKKVQRAMLPSKLPEAAGLDLATYSEAAFEASGDFYDAFEIGDEDDRRVGIVVCDVAGKGVASALIMSATRASLRAEAQASGSPGAVLAKVNDTLAASVPHGLFVTIFYGIYDPTTREFRYASGGHPHPVLGSAQSDGVRELESSGLPLGLIEGSEYEDRSTVLEPGDFVLVYTDGLAEALDMTRQMYGFDAVHDRLSARRGEIESAEDVVEVSLAGMRAFIGDERLHDDVTVVALRIGERANAMAARDDATVPAWTTES